MVAAFRLPFKFMSQLFKKSDIDFSKIQTTYSKIKIAILGYGIQGRAQALNLRDLGFAVIVGQRENSERFRQAKEDGWVFGETLFSLEEAAQKADFIFYLLSDAGQKEFWPSLLPFLTEEKTLVFAHGFAIVYAEQTQVVPPKNIDVILVAPKGSGTSMRQQFLNKQNFMASFAVHQNFSGDAFHKAKNLCFAIGADIILETTFENEVTADLVSERGVILGGLMAMMESQFETLVKNGHSAEEAFADSVEEVTSWLAELVGQIGFDGVLKNCSTTAKWGALKWREHFRAALNPVFAKLYQSVKSGEEAREILQGSQDPKFQKSMANLENQIAESQIWQTAKRLQTPSNLK